jgi:hypothetical protein
MQYQINFSDIFVREFLQEAEAISSRFVCGIKHSGRPRQPDALPSAGTRCAGVCGAS